MERLLPSRVYTLAPKRTYQPPRFRMVCSHCGEPKDGLGPLRTGDKISHGLHPWCADELRKNWGIPKRERNDDNR